MKRLFVFFLLISINIQAQDKDLIRVNRVNGVEAYFMSEPLRDYEVVVDKSGGLQGSSFLTGGLVNESISTKASKFVQRMYDEAKKEGKEIDAVIYSNGKRAVGIKFKDEGTTDTKGVGRVHKIEGVGVFVLGEPLKDYEVIETKKGGLKMKSAITGGLVNNSIEEDIEKFVKRLKKEDSNLEGVVYSTGKSAASIKFK